MLSSLCDKKKKIACSDGSVKKFGKKKKKEFVERKSRMKWSKAKKLIPVLKCLAIYYFPATLQTHHHEKSIYLHTSAIISHFFLLFYFFFFLSHFLQSFIYIFVHLSTSNIFIIYLTRQSINV